MKPARPRGEGPQRMQPTLLQSQAVANAALQGSRRMLIACRAIVFAFLDIESLDAPHGAPRLRGRGRRGRAGAAPSRFHRLMARERLLGSENPSR